MQVKRFMRQNIRPIRVVISGGGTGGHIFPALAIAQALQRQCAEVQLLFVGAQGRMEMQVIPAAGYNVVGLPIAGLQRTWSWKNVLLPLKVLASCWQAWRLLGRFRPQAAVGVGGYASFPVLLMARLRSIPGLIQEQNSYAGLANRILGRWVKKICVAYPGMERFFPQHKIVITGNPVRRDLLTGPDSGTARRQFGLLPEQPTVLVLGGSLGAASINQSIADQLDYLLANRLQLIWQTGTAYFERYRSCMERAPGQLHVLPFIRDMAAAYAAADVVVSRAGALAIAELCVTRRPAILIPSPHVAENHQLRNAEALVANRAAVLVTDAEAKDVLAQRIVDLMMDAERRRQLAQNIAAWARPDADEQIAREILGLIPTIKETSS